ncbi:lipopolysaccharide biosynthesis protein [Ornithinimicrobium kibberense]|nr:hypothetical protein [Ornithinimicrobium kibberense]
MRTAFVRSLDVEYLGLNGLFTSLTNILSAAELGIGTAIAFRLYATLAKGEKAAVSGYYNLLKRINFGLAGGIVVLGLLSLPIIGWFIGNVPQVQESVSLLFLLYLAATIVTYVFAHYSALLIADQSEYLVAASLAVVTVVVSVAQGYVLLSGRGFVAYLALQPVIPLAQGLVMWALVRRRLPFVREESKTLGPEARRDLWRDVRAVAIFRVAGVVIAGAPLLLMAGLFGVVTLGVFSNYHMLVHALQNVIRKGFAALTPSLGALNAKARVERKSEAYRGVSFAAVLILGAAAAGLFDSLNGFVVAWIGAEYLLDARAVLGLCLVFFLQGVTRISNVFRDAFGLFQQGQLRPLFLAILVVVLAWLGGTFLEIHGFLGGWALAYCLVPLWFDPWVVHRHALNLPVGPFFLRMLGWTATVIGAYAVVRPLDLGGFWGVIGPVAEGAVTMAAIVVMGVAAWWKSAECRWLVRRVWK